MRTAAVVPTLDEAARVADVVRALAAEVDEVIVSDGGSADGTAERAAEAGARVVVGPAGRGAQLDRGAAGCTAERIWFVHADTRIPAGAGATLRAAAGPWGCYATRVDSADPRLWWTGVAMTLRARATGVCSGDMAMWADRAFLDAVGGFGAAAVLEDLAWADRARAQARGQVLGPPVTTSARRWEAEGVNRTILRFWLVRAGYRLGVPAPTLARVYASRPRGSTPMAASTQSGSVSRR